MIKQTHDFCADEVECTCIRFKGKKPVCVGSNCNAEPAGTQGWNPFEEGVLHKQGWNPFKDGVLHN